MKRKERRHQQFLKVSMVLPLYLFTFLPLSAQTFTQQLEQSKTGEGKVTVTQDKDIEELVNGPKFEAIQQQQVKPKTTPVTTTQPRTDERTAPQQKATESRTQQVITGGDTVPDTTSVVDDRKKVMKGGYKINGYRVQVYAGGNSRDSRVKAEKAGKEINTLFPGEPVYVHFYSPRWICRMGNYRTYEEAHQILNAVKKLGYNSAIIVKGKITVSYQTPSNP